MVPLLTPYSESLLMNTSSVLSLNKGQHFAAKPQRFFAKRRLVAADSLPGIQRCGPYLLPQMIECFALKWPQAGPIALSDAFLNCS